MKWVLVFLLAASPATAFERMQGADCQNAWIAATEALEFGVMRQDQTALEALRNEALLVETHLTDDGWCRIVGETPGLEGADFATFDWQAEGIDRFIKDGAPPLALRVRLTDVQRSFGRQVNVDATMRQVPGEGLLMIEAFNLSDDHGDWLSLSAVLSGAFFETRSSALSSFGGVTVQQLAARVSVDPDRQIAPDDPGLTLADDLAEIVTLMQDGLDATQLDDDSRAELTTLSEDLPDANGRLELRGRSDRGLGWMQIAGAMAFNPDATPAEALGFALSGVTVTATWTPVE